MPRHARALLIFLVGLLAGSLLPGSTGTAAAKEVARYAIYLQGSRVGSLTTVRAEATLRNRPAIRLDANTQVRLTTLGASVEQTVAMTHWLDRRGRPLQSRTEIRSLGRTTLIEAEYFPDRIVCTVDAGGQKSRRVVPIPKGVTLVGDPQLSAAEQPEALRIGRREVLHFFEPMTLTIQKVETEVLRRETRKVGGREVTAYLLKSNNSATGLSEMWIDAEGRLLEDTSALGLRVVREDAEPSGDRLAYEPPKDFAVATSVKTAVRLPDARNTRRLRLRIRGLPGRDLVLSDAGQRVLERQEEGDRVTVLYQIEARELPESSLPLAPGAPGTEDAPYLGVNDPEIRRKAKELVAGAADRGAAARRIRDWVKAQIRTPKNVGTPRSAAEIMASRDGVCRDFAILFTALARAAGIPTRIASGILYFEDGYYYHAWAECRLTEGDDGWYPFDPTLPTPFVDATHVKFAQGEPAAMFAAVRAVGHIQAEILEFEPAAAAPSR